MDLNLKYSSNLPICTIEDCTFVYHDKSAVFPHFRAK